MTPNRISRRSLIHGAASIAALGTLSSNSANADDAAGTRKLKPGSVILFQGDSITDAGRKKDQLEANNSAGLGKGYPALAAGELLVDHADLGLKIYNRGISGNKIPDLAARWQKDCIDLKPDILSILIGVNDLWHTFAFGSKYKGTVQTYEEGFRKLLEDTQKALPEVRIVICDPFTTRTSDAFKPLADYREAANKLAKEFNLTVVPFQSEFDKAVKTAPAEFWLWDGIHPSPSGHALMAQAWRRAVGI